MTPQPSVAPVVTLSQEPELPVQPHPPFRKMVPAKNRALIECCTLAVKRPREQEERSDSTNTSQQRVLLEDTIGSCAH